MTARPCLGACRAKGSEDCYCYKPAFWVGYLAKAIEIYLRNPAGATAFADLQESYDRYRIVAPALGGADPKTAPARPAPDPEPAP